MASTYVNDLRLNEMATGDQSGAWGTVTNLNLEMIAEAFAYGTEAIANASTHTVTVPDGAKGDERRFYLKCTGGGQACTVTLAPNTVSKVWMIENATSATLTFTQGSGANVAVLAGQVKMIATDGAGSGAVIYDLLTDVNLAGTTVTDNLTVGGNIDLEGNIDVNGTTNLDAVDVDGAVQIDATVNVGVNDTGYDVKFFGDTASAYMQWDASADDLILGGAAGLVVPQDKLTIASTAVTSTAAELNQLDAITRGSILYGNASGATARLAKGGADTVLTSDGTDISWAAAGGGGGEQTFTATGAISAGNLVGLTSSGTISVSEAELQAAVAQGSGADSNQALVYDTANDKVLLFFQGTSNYLYGRVGTIANGQISFGTVASTSYVAGYIDAAYDVNSGKTVVVYTQSGGNNYPYAIVATVSGTTLSFGTPVAMKSSAQYNTTVKYDSNAQKVLCIYNANGGAKVLARVGTVSGTSIGFGTETAVSALNAVVNGTSLSFDSTANKFIFSYLPYDSLYQKIRTLTISGTSVSGGTEIQVNGLTSGSHVPKMTYIPSLNKSVLISNYGGSYYYYYILTVSGTDVTAADAAGTRFDAIVDIGAGQSYLIVAGDKQYIQYYETAGSANTLLEVSVGAAEITFAPLAKKVQWGTGSSSTFPVAVYDPDTGSLVNADGTNVRIFNVTAPVFVGIAAENISNGATGKATVVGGINTSVSGLTTGKTYGLIPSSASISEIGINGVGAIGVALSSSSIYLNVGKI